MSHTPPPPPPGFEEIPTPPVDPAAVAHIPPPAEGEGFETDVLKRHAKFSWKNFGGDGFLVSVAVHVLLAIIGIFYVISKYTEPPKPKEDVFSSGAGGGNGGEKAKNYEHKMKSQRMMVSMPSRIVSKSANASIALPSTPNTATASFSAGLSSGGVSKGSGGGAGGGEGTGIGIGKGGGRNFNSLFGARGLNVRGIPGYFYDFKQTAAGKPSSFADYDSTGRRDDVMNRVFRAFVRNWNTDVLDKYFRSPEPLVAGQIFWPAMDANKAPQAFDMEKKAPGKGWCIHYKGIVKAPKTGRFRFVVRGDDSMIVRFNGKIAADWGWVVFGNPGNGAHENYNAAKPHPGATNDTYKGNNTVVFRAGPWFEVTKGTDYPFELFAGEWWGGLFSGYLLMEEADPNSRNKPDAAGLFLFRMNDDPPPEGLNQDSGLKVDMSGKGLVWLGRGAKTAPVR